MFQRTCRMSGFVCAVLAVCAAQAAGSPFMIGVNFVGNEAYSPGGEAVLDAADFAGAIPQANWNNAYGGCHTLADLLDADGEGTGLTVTWRAGVYYLGVADLSADHRLMRGHLAPLGSDPITVTVTGLGAIASGPYDVLVYFDVYNSGQQDADVAMTFTIGSSVLTGTDLAGADFAGTFVEDTGAGGNVVQFGSLTGDEFTLEASGAGAAVNALQIHQMPEPATLLLMAVGAAALVVRRRRVTRSATPRG